MAKDYSPFTPGSPVPIEFFVGREQEVNKIIAHVGKSVAKKTVEPIFITGDRGIGKSSLAKMGLRIADENHEILGAHVCLGGVDTLEEMIRRVFERLLQESRDRLWFEQVKGFLGSHVKKLGLFGVELAFEASPAELRPAVNDLGQSLRNLLKQVGSHRKGLMLVLDDLNGLAAVPKFAHWLKSLVDEIALDRTPLPLTLVLIGLPERRRQLIENQPSLDRVFDVVVINRFDEAETKLFFEKAFATVDVCVTSGALDILWRCSGGYPVFLHEIGDATFAVDSDGEISPADAYAGVVNASTAIGTRYIEPKVLDALRSERYRSILKKFSTVAASYEFSKAELLKQISPDEAKVLHNFLQKMKQLGVIVQAPEIGIGRYRFANRLYAMFFSLQAAGNKDHPK